MPGPAEGEADAQKKTLSAAERDEALRTLWREDAGVLDPADLLFLDETSTHTAFTRLRARAPKGQRAHGTTPRNHGPNVTLLAVLGPAGIVTALAIPGATTRPVFDAFVDQLLAPQLRPGQTVVLDNLGVHTSARAQARIEAAGGQVVFLPAYSPDFNPIEPIFAKIKTSLRSAAARSHDDLLAATKLALDAVTAQDAAGCYADGGYSLRSHDA